MTTRQSDAAQIVARIKRVGWPVKADHGYWKITLPNGEILSIHRTSSDINQERQIMRSIRAQGFEALEKKVDTTAEKRRQAKIEADRIENDKAIALAQRRASLTARAAGPYAMDEVDDAWFLKPHPAPVMKKVMVSPALAGKLLDLNTHNRPKKPRQITRLVKKLSNGIHTPGDPPDEKWILIGNPASIDSNGVLQDGQNRFYAIVEADTPAPMFIVVGLDPAAFPHVDTNVPRSAADNVSLEGGKDRNALAAIIRLAWKHQKVVYSGTSWKTISPEHSDVVALFKEDRERFAEATALSRAITQSKALELPRNAVGAALYLMWKANANRSLVDEFIEGIRTGEDIHKGDPRLALVRAARNMARKRGMRETHEALALILKAWKAYVAGEKLDLLRWSVTEPMPRAAYRTRTGVAK